MVGSLDHVLANGPALADVNAVDVWDINGYESVYYEYARYNTNVTNLYTPNPFRSSDHSPEIVGIHVARPAACADTTVTGRPHRLAYGKTGSVAVEVAPVDRNGLRDRVTGPDVLRLGRTGLGERTVDLAAKSLPVGTHT